MNGRAMRIGVVVCAVLVLCGWAGAIEIVAGPYLQNPTETSMTVMWITDCNATSWIEYGQGESLERKAFHSRDGLIDADVKVHRITIEGLSAGQSYRYRVCSKEILKFKPYEVTYGDTVTGEPHGFTTLDRGKEQFSFIVLNDIHERNDLFAALLKVAEPEPYDLVFLNGDILGHIENQQQIIDHVLNPCVQGFASERPFVYVRGNHEARGRFARRLSDYIALPKDHYYYSFDHGPVHFIILDGGEDKEDSHWAYSGLVDFDGYREAQRQWLVGEVQSEAFRKAAFRVVIVHVPAGESDKWHGPTDMYRKWWPVLNRGKVDLMLCGHIHSHMILEPEKGVRDYPLITGGAPKPGETTVIRVDADTESLDVTVTTDAGKVLNMYTVKKR